jgi:hypothetical protein
VSRDPVQPTPTGPCRARASDTVARDNIESYRRRRTDIHPVLLPRRPAEISLRSTDSSASAPVLAAPPPQRRAGRAPAPSACSASPQWHVFSSCKPAHRGPAFDTARLGERAAAAEPERDAAEPRLAGDLSRVSAAVAPEAWRLPSCDRTEISGACGAPAARRGAAGRGRVRRR